MASTYVYGIMIYFLRHQVPLLHYYKFSQNHLRIYLLIIQISRSVSAVRGVLEYTRARCTVLGLAYVKLGTSSRWVGTRIGAGVTTTLRV